MMDTVLQGLRAVLCYIDDIHVLVSGEDEASHFKLLEEVFSPLEEVFSPLEKHGFRLKQEKVDS